MANLKFLAIAAIAIFQIANIVESADSAPSGVWCAKGPSYWCKSIQHALECNAFAHCLQTVWTKHFSYLNEHSSSALQQALNPSKCSNCLQCFQTDFLFRCPVVRDYQTEVKQLTDNKLPASSICKLLEQCADDDFSTAAESIKPSEESLPSENRVDARFECGLHPRQWCDNLETAEKCYSFEQCLHKWSQSSFRYVIRNEASFTENLSESQVTEQKTCGFCVFIFTKLHDILEQNDTEIDIEVYLKGACTLLPNIEETRSCNSAVEKYMPEIYVMLRNNLDPGIICRVLKMCDDSYLKGIPIQKDIEQRERDHANLQRKVWSEVKETLSKLKMRVLNEKEAVVQVPKQQQQQQHLLGRKDEQLVAQLKSSMGIGCELCEIVLTAAKHMIDKKVDDKEVLDFVNKQLCARMGTLKQKCSDYVNLEGEDILDLLRKAVDPALVCEMMGFCLKIQVSSTLSAAKFYDLNVRNNLNCTLCKMVFNQVKKMMTNNEEQEKIINYLNSNLCAKVGKSKELCHSLLDAYGPLFLEIIARDVDPEQICDMIGMCTKLDDNADRSMPMFDIEKVESNTTCIMCEFALKLLSEFVTENATEPELEKIMQLVCQKGFPVSLRDQCSGFVAQYGPVVISLLVNGIKPDKVCQFVGVCPKSRDFLLNLGASFAFTDEENIFKERTAKLGKQKQELARQEGEVKCVVCEYAVQFISQQAETERAAAIPLACQMAPSNFKRQCELFMQVYGAKLVHLINTHSDASSVCQAVRQCGLGATDNDVEIIAIGLIELEPATKVKPVVDKNNTVECSLCLYIAEIVDKMLKENKTEEQITKELELVCNLFPTQLKDQCVAFIGEYGPYIVQLVSAELDPEMTCAALKLCDKSIQTDIFRRVFVNKLPTKN